MEKGAKLYSVDTGYACAGVVVDAGGVVVEAAPIFGWMLGKPWAKVCQWMKIEKIELCAEHPDPWLDRLTAEEAEDILRGLEEEPVPW